MLQLLEEPEAAVAAYGLQGKRVLVLHVGGRSAYAWAKPSQQGRPAVHKHLDWGGSLFDQRLVDHCVKVSACNISPRFWQNDAYLQRICRCSYVVLCVCVRARLVCQYKHDFKLTSSHRVRQPINGLRVSALVPRLGVLSLQLLQRF